MRASGESYGVIGALQAFPLRLATRRVQALGGRLHRNITRGTTAAVLGRKLLASKTQANIEQAVSNAREKAVPLLSENGFLRLLRSLPPVPTANRGHPSSHRGRRAATGSNSPKSAAAASPVATVTPRGFGVVAVWPAGTTTRTA